MSVNQVSPNRDRALAMQVLQEFVWEYKKIPSSNEEFAKFYQTRHRLYISEFLLEIEPEKYEWSIVNTEETRYANIRVQFKRKGEEFGTVEDIALNPEEVWVTRAFMGNRGEVSGYYLTDWNKAHVIADSVARSLDSGVPPKQVSLERIVLSTTPFDHYLAAFVPDYSLTIRNEPNLEIKLESKVTGSTYIYPYGSRESRRLLKVVIRHK